MPRAIVGDIPLTTSYIPKVFETPGISPTFANFCKPIEDRCIHEGRVVDQFTTHLIILIVVFPIQVTLQRDKSGHILISSMIQNGFITLLLAQFSQILQIPYNGHAVFTNKWDLSSLAFFQETEGPYYTDFPTPDEIHQFLKFECVDSNCTIKNKSVTLIPNQVLTKEVREYLKRWEELIRENVFSLGGHLDHLPACLSYILYCILAEQQCRCGMFLTRLFRYVIEHYPHLDNGNVVDRVMHPLALRQTRRP
nr:hypothetical protein [Tanacetum cinerariifolium]